MPLTVTRPARTSFSEARREAIPALARYAFRRTNSHYPGVPVYISLMKWTSQGMGGLPAWRDRIEEGERAIRERGGKLLDAYVTLGRFDVVEIFEAPDDETAYQCLVAVARHGTVTTETLRAFTREEAEEIVKNV
jgi:uncharacterized protein with GYD domain